LTKSLFTSAWQGRGKTAALITQARAIIGLYIAALNMRGDLIIIDCASFQNILSAGGYLSAPIAAGITCNSRKSFSVRIG
jgi:hypothetical protein